MVIYVVDGNHKGSISKCYQIKDRVTKEGPGEYIFCPMYGGRCNQLCPSVSKPFVIEQPDKVVLYGWECLNRVVAEKLPEPPDSA